MATSSDAVSEATSPPKPTATGYPEGFIGYSSYAELNALTTWFCDGKIWRTYGNYAVCCPPDPNVQCFVPTACQGSNTLVGPKSDHVTTCPGSGPTASCITGYIYDQVQAGSTGSTASPVTNIGCWPSWQGGNWNATRTVLLTTASGSTVLTTGTLFPPPTSSARPISTIITSFNPTLVTESRLPTSTTPSQSSSELSTGARAGIGVGAATVGLSFICIMVFIILRYKKQSKNASSSPEDPNKRNSQRTDSSTTDRFNTYQMAPVNQWQQPVEAPGDERRHSELEAQSSYHVVAGGRDGVGTTRPARNLPGPEPARASIISGGGHPSVPPSNTPAEQSAPPQDDNAINEDAESFISAPDEWHPAPQNPGSS